MMILNNEVQWIQFPQIGGTISTSQKAGQVPQNGENKWGGRCLLKLQIAIQNRSATRLYYITQGIIFNIL